METRPSACRSVSTRRSMGSGAALAPAWMRASQQALQALPCRRDHRSIPQLPAPHAAVPRPPPTLMAAAQVDEAAAGGVHSGCFAGMHHSGGHAIVPSAAAQLGRRQLPRRAAALPQLPVVCCWGVAMLCGGLQRRKVGRRCRHAPQPVCIGRGSLQPLHVGQHLHMEAGRREVCVYVCGGQRGGGRLTCCCLLAWVCGYGCSVEGHSISMSNRLGSSSPGPLGSHL